MGDLAQLFTRPLNMSVDRKPPDPPPIIILPPAAEAVKAGDSTDAQNTADVSKKKQKGAQGMGEDKKTGPQGLGEVPAANQERKTLLGY